jgi:D-threo-aldose 1-dehydrogenase
MFRDIPEGEAAATVDAAWGQGIRYFDTAPFYGAGLSEMRLGKALAKHKRDEYVLSSKVGRLILDEVETGGRDFGEKAGLFEFGRPNRIVYDYSGDGALRSIEDSLKRLGVNRPDFVWVHDIARDFHGDEWLARFETARTGAFRALTRLREQGVIRARGLGVNRVEPCELTLDLAEAQPDGFLLAGRYTLLDHERALQRLMPAAAAREVDIVVGGPYSSGVLAGGTHFEYQKAPPEILAWFITGCSSGFGRELARAVVARGYRAAVTARDPKQVSDIVAGHGDRALALRLDVTDPAQVAEAVRRAEEHFGRIDVLVNNAGIGYFAAVEESEEAEVRRMFEIDFFGLAKKTQAVLLGMRKRRSGHIINVASIAGLTTFPSLRRLHMAQASATQEITP